jgi:hypothetical protein
MMQRLLGAVSIVLVAQLGAIAAHAQVGSSGEFENYPLLACVDSAPESVDAVRACVNQENARVQPLQDQQAAIQTDADACVAQAADILQNQDLSQDEMTDQHDRAVADCVGVASARLEELGQQVALMSLENRCVAAWWNNAQPLPDRHAALLGCVQASSG